MIWLLFVAYLVYAYWPDATKGDLPAILVALYDAYPWIFLLTVACAIFQMMLRAYDGEGKENK